MNGESSISRRRILAGTGLAVGALSMAGVGSALAATGETQHSNLHRWYELNIIGDDYLDSQLLRQMEAIWHGMGDVGEILDTASRVEAGNPESWFEQWFATAERVHEIALASENTGHPISAGEAYLRASNYYRGSEWFDHDNSAAQRHTETFLKAISLLGIPATPINIPYEGTSLPGYFFRADDRAGNAPLLIAHSGFDGTTEEMKFIGEGAVRRGYHALLFTGPGQGLVIRKQGITFRHDWENVIGPVIDFALQYDGVDGSRIGLMGNSFGGLLAPRAAAFDNRLKALVANPGVLNFYSLVVQYFGEENMLLAKEAPEEFNTIMYQRMASNIRIRMSQNDSMLKFGARTPAELPAILQAYDNTLVVGQIKCKTLVMDGTDETVNSDQAMALYNALQCPKDYLLFDERSTASLHCQTGALALSNQKMFDWLDDNLMT